MRLGGGHFPLTSRAKALAPLHLKFNCVIRYLPEPARLAGGSRSGHRLSTRAVSGHLPPEKGWDFELIVIAQIMHRSLPAVRVESLVRRSFCIFRHDFRRT